MLCTTTPLLFNIHAFSHPSNYFLFYLLCTTLPLCSTSMPFLILQICTGSHIQSVGWAKKITSSTVSNLCPIFALHCTEWSRTRAQKTDTFLSRIFRHLEVKTKNLMFILFIWVYLSFQDVLPSDSGQYECQVKILHNLNNVQTYILSS